MFTYLTKFVSAAKAKLTTYLALVTGFWSQLPDLIHDYWGQMEQAVPHLSVYHKAVMVVGVVATIWARVRRELHPPAAALLLAILLPLLPIPALAAGHTATITWTPSTVRVDGTPITGAVTFNLYQGVGAGNEGATPAFSALTGTSFTVTTGLADGSTVCWQMTELEAGNTAGESSRTNEVCTTFPASPPAAPSGVKVTIT